jgi:glycosyltransferase involved in cell wall biosynthesis
VLICPKIPPTRDGVGDYTFQLASEISKRRPVTIVTTAGQATSGAACRVLTVPNWTTRSGMAPLWAMLDELRPSLINVQWVPFLWGRWGVNFALPLAVLRLRRAGYRVVTTVHEPYVPFDMWRRLPMGAVQRLELWTMMLGSAKVAVTISAWTRMFKTRFFWRRGDIFWLPVGSNIPPVAMTDGERAALRRSLGFDERDVVVVMFNPLGAGKLLDLSYRAWSAIRERQPAARLLVIGCDRQQLHPEPPDPERVVCTGYVEPAQVSRLLTASDLCLAAYIDGISTRRGAVMAAMEHGLPIVGTRGFLTDCEVFDASPLALSDVADERGFVSNAVRLSTDATARNALRVPTASFYQRHFSWPIIADSLLEQSMTAA